MYEMRTLTIRQLMKKRDLSVLDVADRAGIWPSQLSMILNAPKGRRVREDTAKAIARGCRKMVNEVAVRG